jgi:phosphate transport system substrate-binding protein
VNPLLNAIHHPRFVPVTVALILAALVLWLCAALYGWRRIMWRELMDTPVTLLPRQVRGNGSWAAWKIVAAGQEVADPSLVLLRVRNSGFAAVSMAAMRRPLMFTFPGREVQEFSVTDRCGVATELIQPPGESIAAITGNRIILPKIPMKHGSSFKLLVLLSGPGKGVLGRGPLTPSSCGTGRLVLEGSTAFAPVATQVGGGYTSACRDATISVAGPAPTGYPALIGHPIAVILFGVVLNKDTGVFNLTTQEVRDIFLGAITNWRQVGGANLPVGIVARTTGSGTRATFDTKVLGGAEPLFSSYPPAGSVSASFLNFLNTSTAKDILRSQNYTPCVHRGESLVGTLCP